MEDLMDHHHGGGMYQQPQYIVDDHDHWPVQHPPGASLPPASLAPAAAPMQPLPPLPGVYAQPAGKPVLPPGPGQQEVDDEATESEDERGAGARAPLAWHQAAQPGLPPAQRLESGATAASQPSPTASVSWTAPVAQPAPASASGKGGKGGGKGGGGKPRRPGGKGGITLRMLIEEGILAPGHNVLSVEYKGMTQAASLLADGRIQSVIGGQEMVFESPSAFSIYLKRLVNPSRKADDGWKTVRYNNRVLEQFKSELLHRRFPELGSGVGAPSAGQTPAGGDAAHHQQQQPAKKRARVDSSSDLTGGSMAVSATVKDGDRNVLKLKFARPKREDSAAQTATAPAEQARQATDASPQLATAEGEGDAGRSRPRRQVHRPHRYTGLGADDEHALQPLEAYAPGPVGAPGCQPFALLVHPSAELAMDFHAHLSLSEVIGMLAGTYDSTSRTISVLSAHPVRELDTEDDAINVEMDPEEEWNVRQRIASSGLRVVGWYHSHPTFPTQPSTIDIYNQVLQQHHNRDEVTSTEPYVAAIVGPYDRRQPTPTSSVTWFYVQHPPGSIPTQGQRPEDAGCVAKALQAVQLVPGGGTGDSTADLPEASMVEMAARYAGKRDTVDVAGQWRDGTTIAQKLAASLLARIPPAQWSEEQRQWFAARVQSIVSSTLVRPPPGQQPGPAAVTGAPPAGVATVAYQSGSAAAAHSDDEEISDLDEEISDLHE